MLPRASCTTRQEVGGKQGTEKSRGAFRKFVNNLYVSFPPFLLKEMSRRLGASAAFSAASGTASNMEQILRDGVIGVVKSGDL
jgi:hypothetical protein